MSLVRAHGYNDRLPVGWRLPHQWNTTFLSPTVMLLTRMGLKGVEYWESS